MTARVPKYRFHKASGQALVEIAGRHFYLGKYDSPESHEKYRRLIAGHLSKQEADAAEDAPPSIRIDRMIVKYFRFAKTYYVKSGEPTHEVTALRICLRRLRKLYGTTEAVKFGPKAFNLVRDAMIQEGLSRKYINDSMARIRRMFKWAVAEELLPPATHQALLAVPGLRRGRSGARETEKILPVEQSVVDATLPHLPAVVADMVRLQRLTGMRPAEVCIVRPRDVDRSGDVWVYRPSTHKTEHKDRDRLIPLGPKSQAVLSHYLLRESESYCFCPCDSEKKRRKERHAKRKTPLNHGNSPGTNRVAQPKRTAGKRYNTASYRRAIQRACDRAFPHPILDRMENGDLTVEQVAELGKWRAEYRWSPNQLRHTTATEIRRRYGLEAAQVVLGHAGANVTEVYAERDSHLAAKIAAEIG